MAEEEPKTPEIELSWTVLNNESKDEHEEPSVSNIEEVVDGKKDEQDDDLSDGISIISESDHSQQSTHEHPQNITINEFCREELEKLTTNTIKELSAAVTPSEETEILRKELCLLRQQSQQLNEQCKELALRQQEESDDSDQLAPKLKISWQFLFLNSVLLLAFLGTCSRFWDNSPKVDPGLVQKLAEVSKENLDLKTEIVELQETISRLTNDFERTKERYQNKDRYQDIKDTKERYQDKKEKKIKVWSGNGNSIDQMEIPKDALKKPYSCGDNEEDIGGFCVATSAEQVTEPPVVSIPEEPKNDNFPENKGKDYDKKKSKDYEKKKDYKKNDSGEKKRHVSGDRKNHSGERKGEKHNSGERKNHNGDRDRKGNHSGEKKGDRKRNNSGERKNKGGKKNGEWQDNMMKNREKQRKKDDDSHEKKNWFTERAHAREEARIFEDGSKYVKQR